MVEGEGGASQEAIDAAAEHAARNSADARDPEPDTTHTAASSTGGAEINPSVDEPKDDELDNPDPEDDNPAVVETETEKTSREARAMADTLIDRKIQEIRKKTDSDTNEVILLTVDTFKKGFEDYERDGGVKPIRNPEFRVNGVRVTSIIRQETVDDKKVYTCTVEDPSDPSKTTDKISGEDLAAAHMAINVSEIASNFSDPRQQELVSWLSKGATETPPPATAELIKEENEPSYKAAKVIAEKRKNLQLDVNEMNARGEKIPEATSHLLAQLNLAQLTTGENYTQLAAFGAINGLIARGEDLTDLREQLKPGVDQAVTNLEDGFVQAGMTRDQIAKIRQDGFAAIMDDPKAAEILSKMPGSGTEIFGSEMTPEAIIQLFDAQISPAVKDWLKANKGKIGSGVVAALLLALAVPAAAIAGATVLASGAIGGGRR